MVDTSIYNNLKRPSVAESAGKWLGLAQAAQKMRQTELGMAQTAQTMRQTEQDIVKKTFENTANQIMADVMSRHSIKDEKGNVKDIDYSAARMYLMEIGRGDLVQRLFETKDKIYQAQNNTLESQRFRNRTLADSMVELKQAGHEDKIPLAVSTMRDWVDPSQFYDGDTFNPKKAEAFMATHSALGRTAEQQVELKGAQTDLELKQRESLMSPSAKQLKSPITIQTQNALIERLGIDENDPRYNQIKSMSAAQLAAVPEWKSLITEAPKQEVMTSSQQLTYADAAAEAQKDVDMIDSALINLNEAKSNPDVISARNTNNARFIQQFFEKWWGSPDSEAVRAALKRIGVDYDVTQGFDGLESLLKNERYVGVRTAERNASRAEQRTTRGVANVSAKAARDVPKAAPTAKSREPEKQAEQAKQTEQPKKQTVNVNGVTWTRK